MSDLLSLLTLGANGIAAQNTGVSVATNNVANANTEGYSRERVDLDSLLAAPLVGGVRSGTPDRLQDNLLAGRIRTAAGSLAWSQASADALSDVENRLTGAGPTMDEQLAALFGAINNAAASPTDTVSRDAVVTAARTFVAGIQQRAADLTSARKDADARIRDNTAQASSLAKQLAAANTTVARTNDPVARDQRDKLAKQLSQLVGGAARIDSDGQMRLVLDGGAVLVDGGHAADLTAAPDPTTGLATIAIVDGANRRTVTPGGTIGGDLSVRDQTIATALTQLDQLAYDVTTSFNAVHTANAGLDGATGRPMFTALTQVAGAASAIAVDPTLTSRTLALAAPGSGPGDSSGALALFGLGTQTIASGGTRTLGDAALDIVANVANATGDAKARATQDGLVADHLDGLRDSLAGVDTQEELTNLSKFENTSNAMMKFVSTISDMLGNLIDQL